MKFEGLELDNNGDITELKRDGFDYNIMMSDFKVELKKM